MSASGIYVGQPEAWLIEHKNAVLVALRDYAAGRVSSISGASKSLSRQHASMDDLRMELEEVMYALWKLNPVTYPNPNPKKMMRADFSGC